MQGYQALREGAAWLDLSGRGKIRARGEDRARLLHAMTTNHVQQLTPGTGCYAFFLNAQGRILGDVHILCLADSFLLDTEPETRQKLHQHVDKYIIADDVTLEEGTDGTFTIGVEGPQAASLSVPAPETFCSHAKWGTRRVARLSRTGAPGYWIFGPNEEKADLIRQLESAGAVAASPEAIHTVRLERAMPRYGEDFSESSLPQETQLLHALHFNKGCYLGQEIVERIRSRGHVNRLLVQLLIDAAQPLASGDKVQAGDTEAGAITSAAFSPALGKVVALAYLRADFVRAKPSLTVGSSAAEIAASAPARPEAPTGCS